MLLPDLKRLRSKVKVSNTNKGDGTAPVLPPPKQYLIDIAISAIVIAIQMITKHCKKLKWKRKIVLVTDGRGTLDADPEGISEISKKIKADEMELVVV